MASAKKLIDPKKYSEILSKTQLLEIYMESCSVSQVREGIHSEKKINIEINDRAIIKKAETGFKVLHKYDIKTVSPEATKPSLRISVAFALVFSCDYSVGKSFFDVFKNVNLPLNSWPYLREFVQSTVQRMNLPPLTLPFVRRD
jgi:preprotein translocase subunit SecB